MAFQDEETVQIFVEESQEHLDSIENDLLAIEEQGSNFDDELVNKVFRTAHSIKGGAGFLGFENIKELAHKMENVLGLVRDHKVVPTSEVVSVLLGAADDLGKMVNDVGSCDEVDITSHIEALLAITEAPGEELPVADSGEEQVNQQQEIVEDVSMQETEPVADRPPVPSPPQNQDEETVQIFVEESQEHLESIENDLLAIEEQGSNIDDDLVNKVFRTAHSIKGGAGFLGYQNIKELAHKMENVLGLIRDHKVVPTPEVVSVLLGAADDLGKMVGDVGSCHLVDISSHVAALLAITEDPQAAVKPEAETQPAKEPEQQEAPPKVQERKVKPKPAPQKPKPAGNKQGKKQKAPTKESNVRVNVNLLDSLMNLAGELVLSRNQLLQTVESRDRERLESVAQRMDLVTTELQESVMLTRMQPVGNVFNRFPRLVRELARQKGKEIQLILEGEDVELDKTIIEGISDPLTHLIRNSIDHGIEFPPERKMAGKETRGTIQLTARHEPGQVVLEIVDNGKGMDCEKLANAALEKGLLSEQQLSIMPDREKLNLIFMPGFSTAREVTELSGRGVGMDVVKTNFDRLGGQVDINSQVGRGTTITIKLPLTMAIISVQIVHCCGERFAIPQINLDELIRIPASQVQHRVEKIGSAEVIRLRGQLLPLVKLSDVLGIEPTYFDPEDGVRKEDRRQGIAERRSKKSPFIPKEEAISEQVEGEEIVDCRRVNEDRRTSRASKVYVALVHDGAMQYGLVIDGLGDAEEIVVKPVGSYLENCMAYSGATILGDGQVTLILDAGNISQLANLSSVEESRRALDVARQEEIAKKTDREKQSLLLFRSSPGEQFAIPLSLVLRIEKINMADIQEVGGVRVMPYRGGSLSLYALNDAIAVKPLEVQKEAMAIVLQIAGRETAILAAMPVFAADVILDVDEGSHNLPAIMGSTVIEGQVTLLLNIIDLFHILSPDWFIGGKLEEKADTGQSTILYAEDSTFFRNQVAKFITQGGYQIITAEDGQQAWEKLQSVGDDISLILTDIEMPNLDGLGLVAKIKADSRFDHIPVIALTTLAGEDDKNRGQAAGFDDYLVKLDQEKLMESIRRYFDA